AAFTQPSCASGEIGSWVGHAAASSGLAVSSRSRRWNPGSSSLFDPVPLPVGVAIGTATVDRPPVGLPCLETCDPGGKVGEVRNVGEIHGELADKTQLYVRRRQGIAQQVVPSAQALVDVAKIEGELMVDPSAQRCSDLTEAVGDRENHK